MDGGNIAGRWRGVGGDDGDDLLQFPVPAECQNGVFGPETEFRDVAAFWRVDTFWTYHREELQQEKKGSVYAMTKMASPDRPSLAMHVVAFDLPAAVQPLVERGERR
jgi:hypothetical protein